MYERLEKFQLTHPWGCDISGKVDLDISYNFNSHTREGVTIVDGIIKALPKFQLTHPWGCDKFQN